MRGGRRHLAAGLAVLLLAAGSAGAEPAAPARISPVATIQQDQLFARTLYGRAVQDRMTAAVRALQEENRRIEADLEIEERALTDLRPTLPPAEFRARAEAFDAKVEGIRAAQDAKARALAVQEETDRKAFFDTALPVLAALMRETGAVALLDKGSVLLSLDAIDLTDRAVARIDAELGAGPAADAQPAAPEPGATQP